MGERQACMGGSEEEIVGANEIGEYFLLVIMFSMFSSSSAGDI